MVVPVQLPLEQTSLVVQALPSSQLAEFGVYAQPEAGLQESSVQPFESSHVTELPLAQEPPEQASPVVQAFPSSQAAVLLSLWQLPPEQLSSVQALPSLQARCVPPTQLLLEQASFTVQ